MFICGHGLVVEHVLAKDETGVRFSLAAQKSNRQPVDKGVYYVYKGLFLVVLEQGIH